ncbi:putative GPI-anchored cell surface glycoprotein [Sesbania bispinosa]|nr:putative GPI-anchored cell surface glycoprotein [Sesbania bispinosa]
MVEVKWPPKLDKKALVLEMKRKRLANGEKDKVGAGSSTVAPVTSQISMHEVAVPSSSVSAPRKRSRTEKTPANMVGKNFC